MAARSYSSRIHRRRSRRGKIVVLTAVMMVPLLGMMAFAIDVGIFYVGKAELQRTADSAAMAAAWELLEANSPGSTVDSAMIDSEARAAAVEYGAAHDSLGKMVVIHEDDVEIGFVADPQDPTTPLDIYEPGLFNVARVRVRKDAGANGSIPTFFARVLGVDQVDTEAVATAAFLTNMVGFRAPLDPARTVPIMPFALDLETWDAAVGGNGDDNWSWDPQTKQFVAGSDGIPEFNLYPQDTGSTANRGTVNIGGSSNSTSRVARQIVQGVNSDDLAYHGGELKLDDNLELFLDGDPGISAGFQDELASVIGDGKIIPVFREMSGNGNNGVYTITRWAGIRLCEVDLNGNDKRVIVQAAPVSSPAGIPADDSTIASRFVYSPVWLSN